MASCRTMSSYQSYLKATKAEITETGQSDSQTVTICVGKDLTVEKTAAGTYDRLYKWLIDKSVDDTRIEIDLVKLAAAGTRVSVAPSEGAEAASWSEATAAKAAEAHRSASPPLDPVHQDH